jgi:hypothetical protein
MTSSFLGICIGVLDINHHFFSNFNDILCYMEEVIVPLQDIYKVTLCSSIKTKILLFSGGSKNESNLSEFFSADEIYKINSNEVEVIFSKFQIYKTDSVLYIKLKILYTLEQNNQEIYENITIDDIYVFVVKKYKVDVEKLYRDITKNETVLLTKHKMGLLLLNTDISVLNDQAQNNDSFTYEDLTQMYTSNADTKNENSISIPISIGQDNDPLFITNPLYITDKNFLVNPNFNNQIGNAIDENTLLHFLPISNNELFFCLKDDLLKNKNIKNRSIKDKISELYFPPFLDNQENKEKIKNIFETQDMFHHLYNSRTADLPYETKGIEFFYITMLNNKQNGDKKLFIPLDEIFKNIHSTKNIPYINFNPGLHKENIIRLYSESISTNGKTIPFMRKRDIEVVSNKMTNTNFCITTYITVYKNDIKYGLYVELVKDGTITISSDYVQKPLDIEDWNEIIRMGVNPFIKNLNIFIGSSGYSFKIFESMYQEQIDSIKFSASIIISRKILILKEIPCLTSLLDVYNDNVSNNSGINMKFKLVQGFNRQMAQISLIEFENDNDISMIERLKENYQMTNNEAEKRLLEYKENEVGIFDKESNTGFLTVFKLKDHNLSIEIFDINSLYYLKDLEIYIDGILRISQKKLLSKTFTYPQNKIKELSSKYYISQGVNDEQHEENEEVNQEDNGEENDEDYNGNFDNFNAEGEGEEGEGEEGEEEEEEKVDESNKEIDLGNFNPDNENEVNDIDLDGLNLTEYFLTKLKDKEPKLFDYTSSNGFSSYSRLCPQTDKRQPVIITQEQKSKIDPASFTTALKYGSNIDPEKHDWFICPRYWCLKTNSPLSQDDIDNGKCGGIDGIIPLDAKKVPKGKYIYEFDDKKKQIQHRGPVTTDASGNVKPGEYIYNFPGFVKATNPEGFNLPCCFKTATKEVNNEVVDINKDNKYVSGFQTVPLENGRWGFLPITVQQFLNTNQEISQSKKNPAHILPNKPCLLRYGVEKSPTQSFIACVANIYAYKHKITAPITIKKMKEILAKTITLDLFIRYQNGTLISVFKTKNNQEVNIENLIQKYKDSKFVKSLNLDNEVQMNFLVDTIYSYNNYINFIQDETIAIDHTYLWDAVIDSNPLLMKSGLNLIIIEVLNNDTTENISLICPTNSNNSSFYDKKKESIILLKNGPYYELIYLYEDKPDVKPEKLVITKGFLESKATENIVKTLETIKISQAKFCTPQASKNKEIYSFIRNLNAKDIIEKLSNANYIIEYQISNYLPKCIGLYVTTIKDSPGVFVPCFPSEINPSLETKYMDDPRIWGSFSNTINRLKQIKLKTQIPCGPRIIIKEDLLAVGILTETNQFIQFSNPEATPNTDLPSVQDSDYIIADKTITTSKQGDTERINTVKKIAIEQQFYVAFQTTTRLLINSYDNRVIKNKLLDLISNKHDNKVFKKKLKICIDLLHELLDEDVTFDYIDEKIIMSFVNITSCNKENSSKYCLLKDNKNVLIIPKVNLVSNFDNEILYFGKMADELMRNRRTRLYMFESNFITVPYTQYSVNSNELLIVRSLLNENYFKNIVSFNTNPYVQNVAYDIAEPLFNQDRNPFPNKISLKEQMNGVPEPEIIEPEIPQPDIQESNIQLPDIQEEEKDHNLENIPITLKHCVLETKNVTGNTRSQWIFPGAKEIFFKHDSKECSFTALMYILVKEKTPLNEKVTDYSIDFIKETLCKGYRKYMDISLGKYKNNIIFILRSQGKRKLMDLNKNGKTLEDIIKMDDYYITDLDLWMISVELDLPIVLFSTGSIKLMDNISWLYLSNDMSQYQGPLYFLRSPKVINLDEPIKYSLIDKKIGFNEMNCSGASEMKIAQDINDSPNLQNIEIRLSKTIVLQNKANKEKN